MPTNLLYRGALRGFLITAIALFTFSLSAQVSVSVTGENIPCFGLSNGSATARASGGNGPYTYVWSNGGSGATITNLNAGTYNVTATDANGATDTGSITLTQPDRVLATITDPVQCDDPYVIAVEPSGGVAPYAYNWSTGADTRAVSVPAGDYCVTVVDQNLCGLVVCKTIENNPPGVTLVDVDAQCNGSDDGSITANPNGGVGPYTYAWSNGQSGRTISGLAPGNYRVTLTDSRGCTAIANASIDEPTSFVGQILGDATVCPGVTDAIIRIVPSGGRPPYAYVWSPGGFTTQAIGGQGAGTYRVTVTDANECEIVRTFVVTESDAPEISIDGNTMLCGTGATGTLSATPDSGPASQYTYLWNTGATGPSITGVGPGTFSVTATDANGCTGSATTTVRRVELDLDLSSTSTVCADGNDGTASASATGGDRPYVYQWSNGASTATISGLSPGVYGVTVTEDNGCKVSGSVQVGEPDELVLTGNPFNVSCDGDTDGTINVTVSGGTPAYSFRWSDGSTAEDRTNLSVGVYGVTVTDVNGCTDSGSFEVFEPNGININETVTDVLCGGDNTGRIALAVSGGSGSFSYAWSNGATSRNLNNVTAGSYTVTVTDANECTLTATYRIDEPTAIVLSGVDTDIDCNGDDDGRINLSVSGGTPGYTYRWSNNATTQDLSGIDAGTYTVTVTDANLCTETASFTISEPAEIDINFEPANATCEGNDDGSIDVTVTNGTRPYAYTWSNGASTRNISNLAAGVYRLTVTDANGCTETAGITIIAPGGLNASARLSTVACDGEATGAIDLTVSSGTAPYRYSWSNGATTQDISGLDAGSYTVTITDVNGCQLTRTYEVQNVDPIIITGVPAPPACNDDETGDIDITVTGGRRPYTFVWTNGATTEDLDNVPAGVYGVTVMDANECTAGGTITITEPDDIRLSVTAPDIVCGGTNSGSISVFPAGGTGPYSYLWSNGDTGNTIDNIPAGSYTVTVTDANGCSDVTNGIVLSELPQLSCEVEVDQRPTTGNNGRLSVDIDGGTQPYTYAWSNGATTETISGLSAGTYSVTVTDFNGCSTECTGTLRAMAGLGDFVWLDLDADGRQDPDEPGIENYLVYLKNAAGEIIDSTLTDADGMYAFVGLEPGTYSVLFPELPGSTRTSTDTGDDATDSDADPAMNGMTRQYTLAPNEFNMTVDAGFITTPAGSIENPCSCLNNNTTDADGQLSETVEIIANAGQTWRIVARTFLYDAAGPAPPFAPTLLPIGTVIPQTEVLGGDPLLAKYTLDFLLVDDVPYTVTISNGVFEFDFSSRCFYPVVRFRELPPESVCVFDAPFGVEAFGRLNGTELSGTTTILVNGVATTTIDPSDLPLGENLIEVIFTPDDSDECAPSIERQITVTSDCPAKLGDFVWQDNNGNGRQDPGEPGIGGVKVIVTSQDGTYMDMTTTDNTGMYMFSVPPGTYKITFEAPEDFIPTTPNSGTNDELDSDMDPTMLMTGFYTVGPDEMDFTIDAGFINPCIANIINPGTIGFGQEVCGPGNAPDPFVEIAPATGGEGPIEYLWMSNTNDPNEDIVFWTALPNSNSVTYSAGPVFETTYFTRCVRRQGCNYLESNVITVEVGDDAVADISGPRVVCVGEEAIFQVVNPGNGASITWNFTGSSSTESSNQSQVTTSWSTFGSFSVTLTVTANGCISMRTMNVAVINNPNRCGGNLTANGGVDNLQQRAVTIEWEVPADGTDYEFMLERSTNGVNFTAVANVTTPAFVSGNDMAMYRQADVSPLAGRTFYRVRMMDAQYGDLLSNVVEMQLADGSSTALGRVFPNPTRNGVLHVEMTETNTQSGDVSVQLFDVRGNMVAPRIFLETGRGMINLPIAGRPAGVYFLRIGSGDRTETHQVIVE